MNNSKEMWTAFFRPFLNLNENDQQTDMFTKTEKQF